LNLKELKEILQILEEKEITEFELEEQGIKLRIRKANPAPTPAPLAALSPSPAPNSPVASAPRTPAPEGASAPVAAVPSPEEEGLFVVKSPIVGTFYRSPDPSSNPFVSVGDKVKVGQVLCIIEAMKLMNEIEAEVGGEVVKIQQDNGQPVQYGEPLFVIRPDR